MRSLFNFCVWWLMVAFFANKHCIVQSPSEIFAIDPAYKN